MKLSIIICAFNTPEHYLDSALRSIKGSTLKEGEYEVVLVDDGSELDYSKIRKKYNPVYVKTENRGHLAARLFGIMLARGEYIAFLDSDDCVSVNYHKPMLECAEKNGCDLVLGNWAFLNGKTRAYPKKDIVIKDDIDLKGDEILDYYLRAEGRFHSVFVLWNKIFKKELLLKAKAEIEKTDIIMARYPYSEDALITFFACKNATHARNVHTGYYFYRNHSGQSICCEGKDSMLKKIKCMAKTLDTMEANVTKEEHKGSIDTWRGIMARAHYSHAKGQNLKELYPVIEEAYKQEKLIVSKPSDDYGYMATGLLAKNLEDIDSVLSKIMKEADPVSVNYDVKDEYVANFFKQTGKEIVYSDTAKIYVPRAQIDTRDKITHSPLAYFFALRLFKKGSKARKKLKGKV
ncbi:MAG: glycosyltransferase family 2 protein [Clostridia bacterium]|nr:glycosyltransferase family 2 protein [Clostridia bacterium]